MQVVVALLQQKCFLSFCTEYSGNDWYLGCGHEGVGIRSYVGGCRFVRMQGTASVTSS